MNDREMLELAAKAAGIELLEDTYLPSNGVWYTKDGRDGVWSPLTDDGDALRLAVEIGISISTRPFVVEVTKYQDDLLIREEVVLDGFAATRRAIVRAAAEIGKEIP